jgi:hypothetical protein
VLKPALLLAGARLSARAAPLLVCALGAASTRAAALARTPAEAAAWAAALRKQRQRAAEELLARGEPEAELRGEEELTEEERATEVGVQPLAQVDSPVLRARRRRVE